MTTDTNKKNEVLVSVKNLIVNFNKGSRMFSAVDNVSFDIYKGETLALVGESGSGKTTIGRSIVGLRSLSGGLIYFDQKMLRGLVPNIYKLNKKILKILKITQHEEIDFDKNIKKIIFSLKRNYYWFGENKSLVKDLLFDKKIATNIDDKILEKKLNFVLKTQNNLWKKLNKNIDKNLSFVNNVIFLNRTISDFLENLNKQVDGLNKIHETQILNYQKEIYIISSQLLIQLKNIKDDISKFIKKSTLENVSLVFFKEYSLDSLKEIKNLLKKCEIFQEDLKRWNYVYKAISILFVPEYKIFSVLRMLNKCFSLESVNDLLDSIEKQYAHKLNKEKFKKVIINWNSYYNKRVDNKKSIIFNSEEIFSKEFNLFQKIILFIISSRSVFNFVKESKTFAFLKGKELKDSKRNVQMIFQDPSSSINDRMSTEQVVKEGLDNFPVLYRNLDIKKEYLEYYNSLMDDAYGKKTIEEIKNKDVKNYLLLKIIKEVGLLPEHLSRYSHEFSGGQRQRVGVARSLIMNPQLIIADEPISALDVSIRAQILNLLKRFQKEKNLTYLFIAHDLSIVRFISDRIAVINQGKIVELASAEELFTNPLHPYTKSLLSSAPVPNPDSNEQNVNFEYNPLKEHWDYTFSLPKFIEISDGHYLLANERELASIKKNKKIIKEDYNVKK